MYYRMIPTLALRGWMDQPWVLLRRPGNSIRILNKEEFDVLLLCDGETEIHDDLLTPEMQNVLLRLKRRLLILESEEPSPIDKNQCYRLYHNQFVQTVFWSITGRCNFRCRHCYMDAPKAALGELSHDEAIDLIDQMAACGVLCVNITGGEPLVRADFWQLVDRILQHGMAIKQVYTNGWLLSDQLLDEFEKRGLKPEVSVSFDGVGWHDWMRGFDGAEKAALDALQRCVSRGFPTNAEMCVHKGNLLSLRKTVNLMAKIGVRSMQVSSVASTPLWLAHSQGMEMNDDEYYEAMLEYIPHFFEDGMPIYLQIGSMLQLNQGSYEYEVFADGSDDSGNALDKHVCSAIRTVCYITPEGRLLPCMPMTSSERQSMFPLIRDIGLQKGLSDSFYMQVIDMRVYELFEQNEMCGKCANRLRCGGGCRAEAFLYGDKSLTGCDYRQCLFYEKGYPERIHAVVDAAVARCR